MKPITTLLIILYGVLPFGLVAPYVPQANIIPAGFAVMALGSMALALLLAGRFRVVDRLMGGPDKSYRLHRVLGIYAVIGTIGHWIKASPVGRAPIASLEDVAKDAGTWSACIILGLVLMAMLKAIPYHLWKFLHHLMGPVFLLAVFHTFFVASPVPLMSFAHTLLMALSLAGLVGWLESLRKKMLRTYDVEVSEVHHFEGSVDIRLSSETALPKFQAGQFARLSLSEHASEAHPFTIAGGDRVSRRFVIGEAGDDTRRFVEEVCPGDRLRLGRSEGRFLPQISHKRRAQLWVAGGVGITPFLASLEAMEPDQGAAVTLIYCVRSRASASGLKSLEAHAARLPQLNLVLCVDNEKTNITAEVLDGLITALPKNARAYLCGPEGLKAFITARWRANGKKGRVYSEEFDFRNAYDFGKVTQYIESVKARAQAFELRKAPQRRESH